MAQYRLGTPTTADSIVLTSTSAFTDIEVSGASLFSSIEVENSALFHTNLTFFTNNAYTVGTSSNNVSTVHARAIKSNSSFVRINDVIDVGTNIFPVSDNAIGLGLNTNRWADFWSSMGTIYRQSMGTSTNFGRGLLLRGTNLTNSTPGSGIVEYSPLLEFQQSYGQANDPESGYATARMALQGRITTDVGSSSTSNRLAILSDNGTGTYTEKLTIYNSGSILPTTDTGPSLGGSSNRWLILELGNDTVGIGQTSSLSLSNKTAATSGNPKYSPMMTFRGQQWRTDLTASRTLESALQLQAYSFGSISGELSHYFRENNTGSWKYFGGYGTYGTSAYIYLQNDTEGSYAQLQTDAYGTQIFSNRQLSFSAGSTSSTDPSISFSAPDNSVNNQFMLFALPIVSSITAEYNDLKAVPNNATITFNASGNPTITNQRQFYFGRRKLAGTGGTVTFTNAATVAISDAPFADSGATITNGYALLVEAGATYLKGNLKNDGYQQIRTVTNNSIGGDITNTRLTTNVTQTTDATQTTIWSMTLAATTVYWIEARVIAFASGSERALYGKAALVYRDGGAATIQGTVQDVFSDIETTGTMDATFTVNSNDVRLSVTGKASTTMNWVATISYQAVNNS